MSIPGGSQGVQGPPIQFGMVAEPSLTDLLRTAEASRVRFQGELAAVVSNEVAVIQTGFNSIANMMINFENIAAAVNRRIERSEAAILTSNVNRESKKYHGDAGNHKAIQALKMLETDREKFVEWNDKLLNAISRIHPESRKMLKACNKRWMTFNDDRQTKEDIEDGCRLWSRFDDNGEFPNQAAWEKTDYKKLGEDLYYILVEKTCGETGGESQEC